MSGSVSSVGRSGALAGYVNRKVNSLTGVCGMPTQNGRPWRQSLKNKPPYCKPGASKCLAAAGGVGRTYNSYYKTPKSGVKGCGSRTAVDSCPTETLWNKLEKELQLVGSVYKKDDSIKYYKLILVGAGELVTKDMDIHKESEKHFIKFFKKNADKYPSADNSDPDYNLYDKINDPETRSRLKYFNDLAYQLGLLEVTSTGDMEHHVVALCSIETIRALQTQEHKFGIPVVLDGCLTVTALAAVPAPPPTLDNTFNLNISDYNIKGLKDLLKVLLKLKDPYTLDETVINEVMYKLLSDTAVSKQKKEEIMVFLQSAKDILSTYETIVTDTNNLLDIWRPPYATASCGWNEMNCTAAIRQPFQVNHSGDLMEIKFIYHQWQPGWESGRTASISIFEGRSVVDSAAIGGVDDGKEVLGPISFDITPEVRVLITNLRVIEGETYTIFISNGAGIVAATDNYVHPYDIYKILAESDANLTSPMAGNVLSFSTKIGIPKAPFVGV